MKSERRLILGLGNPLAGDDGIGSYIAGRLHGHPRLPADTDVLEAGSDLLRVAHELEGRPHVILVDALLDPGEPGLLVRFDDLDQLEDRSGGVHHLSPVAALRLLRCLYPALRTVPTTFLGVTIGDVRIAHELSPALEARIATLVEQVLDVLAHTVHAAGP